MTIRLRENVPAGTIYARKGERSVCENGHLIATFKRDVRAGDLQSDEDFEFAPGCNMVTAECPICGGASHLGDGGSFKFIDEP